MESITDLQAKELLALMREFYSKPENRAAFERWKETARAKEENENRG